VLNNWNQFLLEVRDIFFYHYGGQVVGPTRAPFQCIQWTLSWEVHWPWFWRMNVVIVMIILTATEKITPTKMFVRC